MSMTVSHSKIKSWRRCRKQYSYKYIENLEPRRKGRPLVFGSICHEMIEAHANGSDSQLVIKKYTDAAKQLFTAEVDEYMAIVNDANLLMAHYFIYYNKDGLKFLSIKDKSAEHKFEIPLVKGITLNGKIDAVCQTKDKRKWLTEHKTHKEIPSEDIRFRDLQTVIYANALPSLGIKNVDGVMWDYIRSKAPRVPDVLKSGKLSKAAIDTLQPVYFQAILDNKLDPKEYQDKLDELRGAEKYFFKRIFMPINAELSKQLLSETVETAKEIQEKGGKDMTRNISRDCSWCSYESLCRAELTGLDADFIRKREFTVRKDEKSR